MQCVLALPVDDVADPSRHMDGSSIYSVGYQNDRITFRILVDPSFKVVTPDMIINFLDHPDIHLPQAQSQSTSSDKPPTQWVTSEV